MPAPMDFVFSFGRIVPQICFIHCSVILVCTLNAVDEWRTALRKHHTYKV